MRKIKVAIAILAVLSMSMLVVAGCGEKDVEESFEFQPRSTEAESTESNAETKAEVDSDTVFATVQKNVAVGEGTYDPTIFYDSYEHFMTGETNKVLWLRTGDGAGLVGNYKSHSYPAAGIENISISVLPDTVDFDEAQKVDYTLKEVASKMHVTKDDFCHDAPYETYDISEAEGAGVFIYNGYDFLKSWRVKTDTYKIDPENIDLKSIVSAYTVLDYEKELDAPLEDGGKVPIWVDPSKVWLKKEEDGTTDYFFLVSAVPYFAVTDASKTYADNETLDNSQLTRGEYPGMMCVRVNPDYDWVHCIMHLGAPRNDGAEKEYGFDNSNYVLRSTARFTPFDEITEGTLWNGSKVQPEGIGEFTANTGH